MEAAQKHPNPVYMTGDHQPNGSNPCQYCNCQECKKYWWSQKGNKVFDPKKITKLEACPNKK